MVAVNGYNDRKPVVEKYVQMAGLQQTVLLNGRDVARRNYSVRAFPTSYWIDHNGVVVKRTVGFAPYMVADMEKRIERMLAARKAEKS